MPVEGTNVLDTYSSRIRTFGLGSFLALLRTSLQPLRDRRAVRTIARSGLFDTEWYQKSNPDVAALGIDPIRHYVAHGANEGRDPSPSFSTIGYLSHNGDVAVAGVNPLEHFVRHGAAEGRNRILCLVLRCLRGASLPTTKLSEISNGCI